MISTKNILGIIIITFIMIISILNIGCALAEGGYVPLNYGKEYKIYQNNEDTHYYKPFFYNKYNNRENNDNFNSK